MRSLVLLGSTGSIGESTLRVVAALPGVFRITGLAAHSRVDRLIEQAVQFDVKTVAVADEAAARRAETLATPHGIAVLHGEAGVCRLAAADGVDPWTVKISVLAARIGKGEDSYWLCVNGKTMQVPANERYYELSLPLAQCLVDEIQARRKAEGLRQQERTESRIRPEKFRDPAGFDPQSIPERIVQQ